MKKSFIYYIPVLILYVIVNILSISTYPFVHSDETWLAGLSRTIDQSGSFLLTEPFFKLYPRQPHTIKSFFHFLQGKWLAAFGYGILQVRALSLLVGLIFLVLLAVYLNKRHDAMPKIEQRTYGPVSFISLLLCAFSAQFIYAAHFGRQEIFILFFLLGGYALVEKGVFLNQARTAWLYAFSAALLTGISIGFHPNSFLIGCALGAMLLADSLIHRRLLPLTSYVLVTGGIAAVFVKVSISWNKGFLADYNSFGDTLGATLTLTEKIKTFPIFLYKIYGQISATYFTPDIRIEFILTTGVFLMGMLTWITLGKKRNKVGFATGLPIIGALGLTGGLILIGRYNATSIVFYLPLMALCAHGLLLHCISHSTSCKKKLLVIAGIIVVAVGTNSFLQIMKPPLESYSVYISNIESAVHLSQSERALCNLNAGFSFEPDAFLDYRDLGMLKEAGMSVETYLKTNNITHIILSEEMDYIYRNQKQWSILYGDMSYYPDLLRILEEQYYLTQEFESPLYGMRITRYADGYPWQVRVYKLK